MSGFLRLGKSDFIKGLVVVIATAVIKTLLDIFQAPGFDLFLIDWGSVLSIAITAGFGYLGKNLLSTENGKLFGKIG